MIKKKAMKRAIGFVWLTAVLVIALQGCMRWSEQPSGSLVYVTNRGGSTVCYDTTSGVRIIYDKGFAFKDLNKNGSLDKYEDWRLSSEERARDLASKLSIEEIAGLM